MKEEGRRKKEAGESMKDEGGMKKGVGATRLG
jgi:hypothetical protein